MSLAQRQNNQRARKYLSKIYAFSGTVPRKHIYALFGEKLGAALIYRVGRPIIEFHIYSRTERRQNDCRVITKNGSN
jgi:hypothetical protein